MEWTVLLESAWYFFLSTFKLKHSVATHMLLLVVNSIYGKHSLDSVADIPIGYTLTGPGVSFLEHVLPLVHHTVKELEVSGIQVKAKGTDLAYAHFIERDKNGEAKNIIILQLDVWDSVRKLGPKKLLIEILNHFGPLSTLERHEVLPMLKMVKFTSWFTQPGKKEYYERPDLTEFGCLTFDPVGSLEQEDTSGFKRIIYNILQFYNIQWSA